MIVDRHTLDFTSASDLPTIVRFVTSAARNGATGIGAGVDYMGSKTLHVGFGSRAVWGKGGKADNAPDWLKKAAAAGWAHPDLVPEYTVMARDGVRLRAGAGSDFNVLSTLPAGTRVFVLGKDGPGETWARVDLQGDGLMDGHINLPYLQEFSTGEPVGSEDEEIETDIGGNEDNAPKEQASH
ncbi:SH3 domain-containing protein [Mesorhizobium sp. M0296]|uniref:SH3 domain-containing protein n=1 Tax=Mesorhizobium sp. M0296 TaxID=2956931 RepID=UPI0033379AB4